MKKSLILGLLTMAASAATSFGQGVIFLDNYNTGGPLVTYGTPFIPANGVSGASGTVGTGLLAGWTMGFYYAVGDVTGSVSADPGGWGIPSTLGGGLTLATGPGSTAAFYTSSGATPGEVLGIPGFVVPGTAVGGGDTITMMMVAYNTSAGSYLNAFLRAHSAAFTMTTSANTSDDPNKVGSFMPGFSIAVIPEPSTIALAGMSGVALLFFRHRR